MIINTQAEFIFVHIPKTAGSSIMESLQSLPGNNDHWLAKTKHETLSELFRNIENRLSNDEKHMDKKLVSFFSFGFVRNPWDRMSSLYRYLCESRPVPQIDSVSSFKEFLVLARERLPWIVGLHSMRPQVDFFSFPDGSLKIDFLGHFEHLDEDIRSISKVIEKEIHLKHRNVSSNRKFDYRLDYDREMIEIVSDIFAKDCFLFGYDFESPHPSMRCSGRLDIRR